MTRNAGTNITPPGEEQAKELDRCRASPESPSMGSLAARSATISPPHRSHRHWCHRGSRHVSPHIYRNVAYRNMGGGIGSMRGSTAIVEENVCFENFYAGIGHERADPLVINNVCCRTCEPESVSVRERVRVVRGNKCYNNRSRGNRHPWPEAATSPVVEDNDCYEKRHGRHRHTRRRDSDHPPQPLVTETRWRVSSAVERNPGR